MVYALWTLYLVSGYGICPWDMLHALGTWYMPLGHGTCPWDRSARATCDLSMGWTAWDGLHGMDGMDCMDRSSMVSRGKTDLFHFCLVSGHAQGSLHVQCQLEHGLHGHAVCTCNLRLVREVPKSILVHYSVFPAFQPDFHMGFAYVSAKCPVWSL